MLGEVEFIIAADHATFFDPHVTYGMCAVYEPIHMLQKMPLGEIMRLSLLGSHERMSAAGFDDLGPSDGFVFRLLADNSLSLVEVAARLGMTSQGALKIVADMETRRYVTRHDDAIDGRVRRLVLTARGRAALREARRIHLQVERQLIKACGKRRVANTRMVLSALGAIGGDLGAVDTRRPF